jgi:hypothetical protein
LYLVLAGAVARVPSASLRAGGMTDFINKCRKKRRKSAPF